MKKTPLSFLINRLIGEHAMTEVSKVIKKINVEQNLWKLIYFAFIQIYETEIPKSERRFLRADIKLQGEGLKVTN